MAGLPWNGWPDALEQVAGFTWNQWPLWPGMGGRIAVESVAGLPRNTHDDPVVTLKTLEHPKTNDETCEPFPLPESRGTPPGELFGCRHRTR